MSKHLKNLKKLTKFQLGLSTSDFGNEILTLNTRRSKLGDLVFDAEENHIAANILNGMVTKYHLKNYKGGELEIFTELSAKCESSSVILTYKELVSEFFNEENSSKVPSSPVTFNNLLNYSRQYADYNMDLYFNTLLNNGKLVVKSQGPGLDESSQNEIGKLVDSYYDTYVKNYTKFLPTYMDYEISLKEINDEFKLKDEKSKSGLSKKAAYISKVVTEWLTQSKLEKSKSTSKLRENTGTSLVNLNNQSETAEKIRLKYGTNLVISTKEILENLNLEFNTIDNKVIELQKSNDSVTNTQNTYAESKSDLVELLDSIDTTFITKQKLVNIISASSAHTLTLKIYSGERLDKIIKSAIAEGKFEIEVFELTDVEAKILLDNGYEVIESDEPKRVGNKVEKQLTWTIRWENSQFLETSGEEEEEG